MKQRKWKRVRNRALFLLTAAVVIVVVYWLVNRHSVYDYTHLTRHADYGTGTEFLPVSGVEAVNGMLPVADNTLMTLYVDPETTNFGVRDKRNGAWWYSCPPDAADDPIANGFEKDVMRSLTGFRYYNEQRRRINHWTYTDAAENGQFVLESIPNGFRVSYEVGDKSLGIDACPKYLTQERFQERVLDQLEDEADVKFIKRIYIPSGSREGFLELPGSVRTHAINSQKVITIFEKVGYTLEELQEDNQAADYEIDLNLDFFSLQLDITLDGDTLAVNLPLSAFRANGENKLYYIDLLKYFGAGSADEDGYLLVPSGSGALINFNNGKVNEESFTGNVYGLDPLMNTEKSQLTTPVRLPVLGIKKDDAAMVAYVDSGSALATVNADIAGKTNAYNTGWFSFLIRDYMIVSMASGSESDMTVVQPYAYDGDITVKYCFLAGEDTTYTDMGLRYQQELVAQGMLEPLEQTDRTPFFLDIIGAVEKRKYILGTPYKALEPMTTYKQTGEILDILSGEGVGGVQVRLLGWFNRGINHDVAKKVNTIGALGSRSELLALNDRLTANGGGLYPSVNFEMVSYYSKNLSKTYEIARDPAGYIGFLASYNRELLRTMNSRYDSDWFLLINPVRLPFHVDQFIPAYNKLNIDALALNDLGDILTESIYRKDVSDRENSRLIIKEQANRLGDAYEHLMFAGGNDYVLGAASYLVDVPTEMDRYYILDHEVPFYEIVVHGYIDYAGAAVNTGEVQDTQLAFLNMLATGAAPHYLWTAEASRKMEFTPYERYYSTQYAEWLAVAAEQYRVYDGIFNRLRTQRITGHEILSEASSRTASVVVTTYENGTRVYVNTTQKPFEYGGLTVPALGYYVEEGAR